MDYRKRVLLILPALALLAAAYERTHSISVMTDAARAYLASLTPEQRDRTAFPFASDERQNWHFVPLERKGVALREMTSAQKHLAEALLSAGLSQQGVIKAHTIMSLDQILKDMEKGKGPERDPEKYYVSIFGDPSDQGTWGYRFEGHHISLNFTVVNGRIASSPNFFGANPAEVKEGPRAGLRALKREEELGRAVIKSLTDAQRAIAIVDKTAYKEIITFDSRKAALTGQPNGLPFSKMTSKQKELLTDLVTDYASNFPQQIAETRMEQYRKTQANLFFAWSGGIEPGDAHYYRIQTPAFLIEYDDTQNNANHIHTVWRDFDSDFGLDLLAQHYQASH
ncbi:MAG TPA: DUF3500 domain-containing protein [Bryobacteraceae bacterium]|nr:DUF3500 domain-containing protein [Bryobacteraceae bacterium]